MRAIRLTLAVLFLAASATAASAYPAGFGCLWPLNNLPETPGKSRYFYDQTDHVFTLKVYLNRHAGGKDEGGVSVGLNSDGPHKVAVCKIIPPHLESLRRGIYWREVKPRGPNSDVYRNIEIREAGTGQSFTDWLVLRAKSATVSGVATIEFHVYTGYTSYAL
jgi:hypothetical protein